MKIQLDFTNKLIRIDEQTNLGDLFTKLQSLLPDWKEWKLDSQSITYWTNPVWWNWRESYYGNPPVYPQPYYVQPLPSLYVTQPDYTGDPNPAPTTCETVVNLILN